MWRGRGGEGGEWVREWEGEGEQICHGLLAISVKEAMWEPYVQVYLPSIDCSCCRQDFGTFHPVC